MERTVLFFGDSITRGYGVGRERCFATLVGDELGSRSASSWRFEVVTGWSSFPSYRQRLQPGLKRVRPEILVLQCPSGPACYFPRFPAPVRAYMRLQKRLLAWLTGRYVQSEIRREPAAGRTSYDALYDGRFLDRLHGWRPSHWPVVGPWWRRRARTYPPIPKVSREGYLKRIQHLVDDAKSHGVREIVLVGLFPMTEDVCPGYLARARQWCADLGSAFDRPANGCRFVDVLPACLEVGIDRLLLRDGIHFTPEGHRAVARTIVPALRPLLERG